MKDLVASDALEPDANARRPPPKDFARSVLDRSREVMRWMDAHVGPTKAPPPR